MLAGKKPLAIFGDVVPSADAVPDAAFAHHVASGVKSVSVLPSSFDDKDEE